MFEYSLVSGLTASGADVFLMHVTPTPSVSYIVRTDEFDCGIMISASHNPFYDNGIKVINSQGAKIDAGLEQEIEDYVDGDAILYICGKYLKEKNMLNHNTVVTTIMSNMGLYKAFDAEGINYEKTTVGDKYVFECMVNNDFILGGEQSGHIIFSKNARTGDGVLTSLKLMEVMVERKSSMSELTRGLKIYPQLLKNLRVTSKPEVAADQDVQAVKKEIEAQLGEDGRILLRESGTEPVIRVMVEAESDELCEKHVNQMVQVIDSKGYIL